MKGWQNLLTNTEIEKRLDKAEDNKDYVQLYIDMFDEEPPITASNWGEFPIEEIIDAIEGVFLSIQSESVRTLVDQFSITYSEI